MKNPYIWSIIYVVAVLSANYTAENFIQLPLFGLLSVGTLIFGITFSARDYVHQLGRKYVYLMIAITAILAMAMSIYLGVPSRIIIASFVTILIAEITDTEIYQRFIHMPWLSRVAISNSVSIPLDSILFSVLAFAGVMSYYDVAQIIWADIVWKFVVATAVSLFREKIDLYRLFKVI